jgi:hypothetical protein
MTFFFYFCIRPAATDFQIFCFPNILLFFKHEENDIFQYRIEVLQMPALILLSSVPEN